MKEKMLCIDGWNIMLAQNSVANILDFNSEPIGMYLTTINQIRSYIDQMKPHKVVFVMDGPNAGERRRKIYSNYKNKRRVTARTSKIKLYSEEDKKDADVYEVDGAFQKQLIKIHEFLKLLPISIVIIPYCEADDVITYIAEKNQDKYDVVICSTDKDYLQLINDNISVYNWRKKALFDRKRFIEDFGILPENYVFQKVLLGDKSDAIKNIKSIGDKAFQAIFQKGLLESKKETITDLFTFLNTLDKDSIEKKFQKKVDLLKEKNTQDSLLLNFRLIKLHAENLKPHHIEILRKQIDEQRDKGFSKLSAKLKMLNDGFNKLYGVYANAFNADKFLQPFVFLTAKNELEV